MTHLGPGTDDFGSVCGRSGGAKDESRKMRGAFCQFFKQNLNIFHIFCSNLQQVTDFEHFG